MTFETMTRRTFLAGCALTLAAGAGRAATPVLHVAKTASCGCCADWVAHMAGAGFQTSVEDMTQGELVELKLRLGIAPQHASCHTARIDGYVVEGHVPTADVRRLLGERPDAIGLAVPGMPIGSPGMEMGETREAFETLLIGTNGRAEVYARHG